ncbi:MAG: hypothetical protein HN729_10410 [Candidatus Marinimicrobia bacterium]|jgi:curli biogenesis system outer membrane secretion channel CsgG|nr:hypothetical protein [Candidatus Neomarinimicrobiota bacterium]MBT3634062.1 hypothetical protein [Candidatus Neomarinimicrobiota bacterium]MBT3683064.1 hypothetical protein [Candidatus Neomarinimicrobiota bacterium]MBT3759844.1 hypothetical protein [Candidatus Neomarinimicrobiota bacterium]MBT3895703.1 hypothetical protein [Candidatus Neomarinimicrobiota bacterium]
MSLSKVNNSKIIAIFFVILIFSSCGFFTRYGRFQVRAERAFSKGDLDRAVELCVDALHQKPGYKESLSFLDEIFPKAVKFHHQNIQKLQSSNKDFKWDYVLPEYEQLLYLVELLDGLNLPNYEVLLFRSEAEDYGTLIQLTKEKAAETHYIAGNEFMKSGDISDYKNCADEFKKALKYIPDYLDSQIKYEDCRHNAITRMTILAFENTSGNTNHGDIGKSVSNELLSSLMNDDDIMEFIDFVTRDKIDIILEEQQLSDSGLIQDDTSIELGNLLGIHQIISGEVTYLDTGGPGHTQNKKMMEKKIVTGTRRYQDSEGNDQKREVYLNVFANAIFHKIHTEATIKVSYKILDVNTSRIIHSNTVTATYVHEYEWVTYSGDKRALSVLAQLMISREERPPPSNTKMVLDVIEEVTSKLVSDIKKTLI